MHGLLEGGEPVIMVIKEIKTDGNIRKKASDLKYYNDILMILSDRWISSREINELIHEDHPEAGAYLKRSTMRTLRRMQEEGMVEVRESMGGEGYKWRLRCKSG